MFEIVYDDDGRTTDGRRHDGYSISSPCEPNGSGELKIQTPYFLNVFTTAGETASSMYSAMLNGIVGVHIDKRVAIGTRSANQNPEFRRICRGVSIEAGHHEYSISFPGDLIRDTTHAQRQFPMWKEISEHNIEFGNKKE